MDLSVILDSEGSITVAAANMHPIDRTDAGSLIADLVVKLHRELGHCGDDGSA